MQEEREKKIDAKLEPIYPWTRYAIGIDPGLKGGIACIDNLHNKVVLAVSTPTIMDPKSGKPTYDIRSMNTTLTLPCKQYQGDCSIIIERQQAMPQQGVVSMFTTGFGYGIWTALIALAGIPEVMIHVVRSAEWQVILRGEDAKDETKAKSITRVHRLFPDVNLAQGRKRVDSDGIADAINIAHYACMRMVNAT